MSDTYQCSQCGADLKEGVDVCPICGYEKKDGSARNKKEKRMGEGQDSKRRLMIQIVTLGSIVLVAAFAVCLLFSNTKPDNPEPSVAGKVMLASGAAPEDEGESKVNRVNEKLLEWYSNYIYESEASPTDNPQDSSVSMNVINGKEEASVAKPSSDEEEYLILYCGTKAPASDFVFPHSSSAYLSSSDLDSLYNSDPWVRKMRSQLAINEIFARYGYSFTGDSDVERDARSKFSDKEWYQSAQRSCPKSNKNDLLNNYLNNIERQNIYRLVDWQIVYVPDDI